jgi:cell division protein FtsB
MKPAKLHTENKQIHTNSTNITPRGANPFQSAQQCLKGNPVRRINSDSSTDSEENVVDITNFILCTICNKYINISNIEKHSENCVADATQDPVQESQDSLIYLQEVNNKISHFLDYINKINNASYIIANKFTPQDQATLVSLIQYTIQLKDIDTSEDGVDNLTSVKKIIRNLDTSILAFKGSIPVLILLERGRYLALEKTSHLKEEYKKRRSIIARPSNINKILELQKEIDKLSKRKTQMESEKDKLKKKVDTIEEYMRTTETNKVDINSDVEGNYVDLGRFSQINLRKTGFNKQKIFENANNANSDNENNSNMLNYKKFCSIVLKIKFSKLSSGDASHKIPEKVLYEEYKRAYFDGIDVAEFILKELKNFDKHRSSVYKSYKGLRKLDTIREDL